MTITYDSIAAMKMNRTLLELSSQYNRVNKALETGSTINRVSDNPAVYNITQRAKNYASLYEKFNESAQIGISLVDTELDAISDMKKNLNSIKGLLEQANTDSISESQRNALQTQVDALMQTITDTRANTKFNGLEIFELKGQYEVTGAAASSFQQLTIDDFTNIQTSTLEALCHYDPEWEDWYGYTYEDYMNDITSRGATTVEFRSGEKDGHRYYFIENADQLKTAINGFRGDWGIDLYSGNFVFLSDIDLSGAEWDSCYNSSTIDGNGHVVKNFSSEYSLIGNNDEGTIKNLGMDNCEVTSGGGAILCGYNYGTIDNCYVTNSTMSGNGSAILCCSNNGGTISNSYVTNSTASGDWSAILCCYNNGGTISNSYVTNSTVSGNGSAIFCNGNYSTISNTYALNITAEDDMNYILDNSGTSTNNYQDHNESDTTATYKDAEWFASEGAATALGNAYELVEGKDHPTLKSNPEPVPPTPIDNTMRIQTGESSYMTIDTTFFFDDNFSFSTASQEDAAASLTRLETVLSQLEEKSSQLNVYRKDFVNYSTVSQNKVTAANNVISAWTGFDKEKMQEKKEALLAQITSAQALRTQTMALNMQMCQMLIMGRLSGTTTLF